MEGFSDQINVSDIFPYDFVKENDVIASLTEAGYEVTSPNVISIDLYHEISRYLKTLSLSSPGKLLTYFFNSNGSFLVLSNVGL